MWALVESNSVTKVYTRPKAITIGDLNYPANIMSVWSEAELNAIGIYEVVEDNTNFKNEEWYINTNVTHTYNSGTGKVDATYGTATAKLFEDRNEVDDDDNPLLDDNGNQVVTKGLKTIKKELIDGQCAGLLQDSDWRVIKAKETGTTMDAGWKTWRASVRTKCNSMQDQIDGASDVDALATLFAYTNTGTEENPVIERPLGEFPIKE